MNVFSMKNMAMVITSKINEFLKAIMAMFIIAFKTFALGGDTHFNSSYTSTQCDMPLSNKPFMKSTSNHSNGRIM